VFDEDAAQAMEAGARAGDCLLLTVELDKRPGEETPRVTVRGARPLDGLVASTRLRMEITVATADALEPLAALFAAAGRGPGEVRLRLPTPTGEADLTLGQSYQLESDLVGAVERLPGIGEVRLERLSEFQDAVRPRARLYAVK
jgi:DNA polymerase III subunit alpha